ncbi:MAG: glycosyltransferase [Bacteroidales bacterium]|nr:glycosyltransferase [Bacteroidales bacterium]
MRILQLCYKPPFPPVDGGTLAIGSVTRGLLQAGCEVKVLTVSTDKHPFSADKIPSSCKSSTSMEAVYIDTRVKPFFALFYLLCGESYHIKRYVSSAFESKLIQVLKSEQFDVVHVESVFLTPYVATIRKYSSAKIVLRAHNIEHRIWRQLSRGEHNPFRKWYLKHLAMALEVYERGHVNDYDGVVCITDQDAEAYRQMGCRRPMCVVPFAVEPHSVSSAVSVQPFTLFHIGSMDWKPNVEAIDWFLSKVWPLLHRELPQTRFFIAGRRMPQRLLDSHIDGVSVVGEVDDAMRFMADKSVNVVPLLSGSGIRVKILEAMSMGKPIVATAVAARGIKYTDGKNILIADTPQAFVDCVRRCLSEPATAASMGSAAVELIKTEYNIEKQTERIISFYNKITNC